MLFSTSLGILSCVEPGHYPVSGEHGKPDDPVKDMDAKDCVVPAR